MVDLHTVTILPTQPTHGVQQPSTLQGELPNAQASLKSLKVGTIISGFIINRDSRGNPILRSDRGDITFVSNFFLKIGSEVQLRIEQTGGQIHAHLLRVDGDPPEVAVSKSSFSSTPDVILSQALSSRQALDGNGPKQSLQPHLSEAGKTPTEAASTNNIVLKSTLIAPAQKNAPALPSGTQFTFKLIALVPPAASPKQPTTTPTTTGSTTTTTSTTSTSTASPATPTTTTTPGTTQSTVTQPSTGSSTNTQQYNVYTRTSSASTPPTTAPPSQPPTAGSTTPTTTPTQNISTNSTPTPVIFTPATTTQPALPQIGQVVTGTVIGNDVNKEAIIHTGLGTIRLQPGTALPTRSQVSFTLLGTSLPNSNIGPADSTAPAPLSELARQWSSLAQIFDLLTVRDRALSIDFIQGAMPWITADNSPAPQSLTQPQSISSGLLFFLSALKGNSLRNWLGERNAQWLEKNGHNALLTKASAEFSSIARQYAEPPSGQWQTILFPVAVEGEVKQVRFFVKRDRKHAENTRNVEEEDTRFIIEMDLSQLGAVQMDGFVREQHEKALQFDLTIRSKTPLPEDIQTGILQLYSATGEITGYRGNLQFQSVEHFPVNPIEELGGLPHNNMMV